MSVIPDDIVRAISDAATSASQPMYWRLFWRTKKGELTGLAFSTPIPGIPEFSVWPFFVEGKKFLEEGDECWTYKLLGDAITALSACAELIDWEFLGWRRGRERDYFDGVHELIQSQ